MGNTIIPGGQTIDTNNPPKFSGPDKQEKITWVSFHFSTNDEPVLPLLEAAMKGVTKIVSDL